MTEILLRFSTDTLRGELRDDGDVYYEHGNGHRAGLALHKFAHARRKSWPQITWTTPDGAPCWVTLASHGPPYGCTLEVIETHGQGFQNWYVTSPSNGKFRIGRKDSKPYGAEDWKTLRHRVVSGTAAWAIDLGTPYIAWSFPEFMKDAPCKRFELWRDEDPSGVSGTGLIAEGVKFGDGKCVMRWRTSAASVSVYDSLKDLKHNHLHGGKSRIVWVD